VLSPNVFIARRTIIAGFALALAVLSACSYDSSAPTYPDGPPPSPVLSAADVVYCRGAEPAWVAFQDGDGAWTRAQPIASGQYTSFHHDFASSRAAVARAQQFASGLTSLAILYAIPSELGLVSDTAFQQCSGDALETPFSRDGNHQDSRGARVAGGGRPRVAGERLPQQELLERNPGPEPERSRAEAADRPRRDLDHLDAARRHAEFRMDRTVSQAERAGRALRGGLHGRERVLVEP